MLSRSIRFHAFIFVMFKVEPLQPIDISDEVAPLASIPLPHSEGKLLSDWPSELAQVAYR